MPSEQGWHPSLTPNTLKVQGLMTVVTAHLHMLASELRSAPTKAGGVWGSDEPAVRALAQGPRSQPPCRTTYSSRSSGFHWYLGTQAYAQKYLKIIKKNLRNPTTAF